MVANMEFNDLKRQQKKCELDLRRNIDAVLYYGQYINGPQVGEIESLLAEYVGVKHAVSCGSGTDALVLALMAAGVGPNDAVFTTAFSFVAAAEAIAIVGANPFFIDIDPRTFNIDPHCLKKEIESVAENTLWNTKAIIPVNLFGLPCDYNKINKIAAKYKLLVIEDMAQSFGAEYCAMKSGDLADIGCASFFPSKPLGCYGDGGMVFTGNGICAATIKSLKQHGKSSAGKYHNERIGMNSRLDTIQAAILLTKFKMFDDERAARVINAEHYKNKIENLNYIEMQYIPPMRTSAHAQFPILLPDRYIRNEIMRKFEAEDIPYQIYYPATIPEMPPYRSPLCVNAIDISNRILCLPFSPYMDFEEIDRVYQCLK
jgi:dTDP-4-amino-4,6-dideoxygalactose transaminase